MKSNEKIKKANEDLEVLSSDEETRELAEFRESSLREMASAKNYGISIGRESGLKEGLKEGEKNTKIQIVKSMLKKKMNMEDIIDITGLSKDEILNISKEK